MISHGSAYFLKEQNDGCPDKYTIYTCNSCHMICPGNPNKGIYGVNVVKIMEISQNHISLIRANY